MPDKEGRRPAAELDMGDYLVRGFKASVMAAGIKKRGGLDLALIFSEREACAAGVFTGNKVKAAPVLLSQENIKKGGRGPSSPIQAMPMPAPGSRTSERPVHHPKCRRGTWDCA